MKIFWSEIWVREYFGSENHFRIILSEIMRKWSFSDQKSILLKVSESTDSQLIYWYLQLYWQSFTDIYWQYDFTTDSLRRPAARGLKHGKC